MAAPNGTKYGIVRYGNVIASRGSVIPLFKTLLQNKKIIPLTDKDMTRFFITLEEAVKFVLNCLLNLRNGELFIPKMNSIYIKDLIKILDPNAKIKIVGIRPGEKIHETLCSKDELGTIYECKNYFIIYPIDFNKKKIGKKIKNSFNYSSDSKEFLNKEKIKILLKKILKKFIPKKIVSFRQDFQAIKNIRSEKKMNWFVNNTGDNCYIRGILKKK